MQKAVIVEFDENISKFNTSELDKALEQGWKITSVTANPGACGGHAGWTPGTYFVVLEKK
ncbi:MAG: hypothetical protein MJ050_09275 [Phascolarctobacterium sp.]|nr:hypothetical protein [Phascolarctobacterium sp.]